MEGVNMKSRISFYTAVVFSILLIFGCAYTSKGKYRPKTDEEKQLIEFVDECLDSYHSKNKSEWLNCFNEGATIRARVEGDGESNNTLLLKDNYLDHIKYNSSIAFSMEYKCFDKKVALKGNEAEINCKYIDDYNYTNPMAIELIKIENEWKIMMFYWEMKGE